MNYSVVSSERSKELPATEKRGALVVYKLSLSNGGSTFPGVELLQKPDTPEPKEGDTLDGQIEQTSYGPRFKKAQMGGNKGGGGGRSPQEQRSIVRQGAEQRAALYLIAKALVKQHLQQDLSRDDFKKLCDWFVSDAEGAS